MRERFDYRKCGVRAALVCLIGAGVVPTLLGSNSSSSGPAGGAGVLRLVHPRVIILKSRHTAYLYDGSQLVWAYAVDVGGGGYRAGSDFLTGETPEGQFHVVTRNAASEHHRFLGLSYPNAASARRGHELGMVSIGEAETIHQSELLGACPPWNTALGGGIGLHGGRRGTDWTGGCVAFRDADIEELFSVLRVGDPIEVLP
ncbi:MAG: L,D-transpeptidase [Phycisphaerales bacterium]|nr:L,D-transpeptidase [Phycisphaerales bacterium]